MIAPNKRVLYYVYNIFRTLINLIYYLFKEFLADAVDIEDENYMAHEEGELHPEAILLSTSIVFGETKSTGSNVSGNFKKLAERRPASAELDALHRFFDERM